MSHTLGPPKRGVTHPARKLRVGDRVRVQVSGWTGTVVKRVYNGGGHFGWRIRWDKTGECSRSTPELGLELLE